VIVLGLQRQVRLDAQLKRSRQQQVTYPEVGLTRSTALPAGYRHDRLTRRVGRDQIAWGRAKDAIRLWKAHLHAGITLTPPDSPIQEGATALASRTLGPVTILAPCRVVYVTDEPTRFGFAYGTLPGHPEKGEEAFHVFLSDDGAVAAEIVAFSRPADLTTKLAGPAAREIQKAVTRRCLEGIEWHVAGTK
jgi:uncharacterized protein (UPF0548 family)